MSRSALPVSVGRIAFCADDSTDRGSCRIRLPASIWTAAGIPYHKPVIVSIPCEASTQAWRLLCVAALAYEDDPFFYPSPHHHHQNQPHLEPTPSTLSPSPPPHTPPPTPPPAPSPQTPIQSTPPPPSSSSQKPKPKPKPSASRRGTVDAAAAVLDPTVVLPPPGHTPAHLAQLLTRPAAAAAACSAEVAACRGPPGVTAATEARVRCPAGQEHLAGPRMSFKLYNALVLPGCWLALSPSCYVEVVSLLPEPQFLDQPLRIVASTRLVMVGQIGEPMTQQQQREQQQKQQGQKQPAAAAAAAAIAAAVEASGLTETLVRCGGAEVDAASAVAASIPADEGAAKQQVKSKVKSGGRMSSKSGSKSKGGSGGRTSKSGGLTVSASLFDALRGLGDDD